MATNSNSLRGALLATTALVAGAGAAVPMASTAFAQNILPTNGLVTSGAASIRQSGANLSVTQTSPRAIVNWGSFSIGPTNGVTFDQPSASSATLNRVTGSTTSTIAGQLQANGQVYLVNPNGIAITKTGAVQVGGGFVASTLGIADNDFNNGNLNFVGKGASAGVSNAGSITASPGGFVGLLGGTVANSGVVSVPLGKVAMGSGEQATLNLTGDNFLQVAMPTNTKTADGQALIDVSGKVRAAGGSVQLRAATVAQAIRNAVNVPGELSVTSARASGGSIILGGGPGGDVSVAGRLRASGRNAGGTIAISGHDVALRQAKLAASSAKGRGGSVTVTGTNRVSLASSLVYASGATGGGAIRIGGDFHGASDLTSAQTTTIDSASTLNASATASGDGGKVAVWSDSTTNFAGKITATGGASGGDGGSVEVSANPATHGFLSYSGFADLTAPKGKTGTLLLDPFDITICNPCDDIGGSFAGGVFTPIATSQISTPTLVTQLGGANVVVSTGLAGSPGTDEGNITVTAPIAWVSGNSLTLEAADGISIEAAITATGAGSLTLSAPGIGPETGFVSIFAPLSTTTGAITITGGGAAPLGIELGANVTTAGGAITFNNPVQLQATVAVNAGTGSVRFGSDVDSAPGISGPCAAGCDLTVSGGGVTFGGNIGSITPLSGLSVTGPVQLRGDISVNTGAGPVSFANTVDSDPAFPSSDLTVNAGSVAFGGKVGSVAPLGTLSVTGATSLGGNVTTTGNIEFNSPVTLAANVAVASSAGTVTFGSTVDSNSSSCGAGCDLTVSGGAVNFFDDVGSLNPLGALSVTGPTTLFANVTTTGNIAFNSPVQLLTDVTVNAGAGTVTFGSTVDSGVTEPSGPCAAGCDFTVTASTINLEGALGGSSPLGAVSLTSTSGITVQSISATFDITLSAGGLANILGPISTGGDISITGVTGIDLGGNVTATGESEITFNNPVQLQGDVTVNAEGGGVSFLSTVDSAPAFPSRGLTIHADSIDLGGALGATNPLGVVSLTPLDDFISLPRITATGDITIGDVATNNTFVLLNGDIATSGGSVAFAGPVFLQTSPLAVTASGAVAFGSTVDAGFSGGSCAGCVLTVSANAITFGGDLGLQNEGVDPFSEVSLTSTNSLILPSIKSGGLTATSTAGGITLSGAVTASGSVALTAADDIIETDGSISAPTLSATSSNGRVVLTFGNLVTSVSGSAPSGFSFSDGAPGPVDVGSGGITSTAGSIALIAAGSITQTGPVRGLALFAEAGDVLEGSGDVILNNPSNAVGTLAGVANGGSFQFANGNGAGLTIGTVTFFTSSGTVTPDIGTGTGVTSNAATVPEAEIQVSTAGNLVLDSPVTGSTPNGLIQLAATANFINNVGPAAVVDPWQVYSASPTGDVFGGLDSGNTAVWNTTFGEPVTAPGNRYVFAFQPTISVTSGNLTKTYGQDVTSLVAADFTITGLQPGVAGAFLPDTAAAVYSGTPSVTSLGSPARASVAGSPYPITVAAGAFAVSDRYALVLDSTGRLTIDPLALAYAVADASSTYGTTATLGAATLSGVLSGDTVDPTVGAFSGTTPVALGPRTPVGAYSQEVTALSNPNYTIAASGNTPGTLTIDPLALTYAVANASSTYGTTATLGAATLFGVLAGDTVAPTVGAFSGMTPVALTPRTPAGAYSEQVTALSSPNYVIAASGNTPGTLSIDPLALTYAVANASSTYGTTATLGAATLFGVLAGDTVAPTVGAFSGMTPVALTPRTPAGAYSEQVTALSSPNYVIAASGNTPGTLTIDPLALTYAVANASSTYGTTATLGAATLFGVLAGDTVAPTVGAFSGMTPVALTPRTPAGAYSEQVTALSSPNYVIAASGNTPGTLSIDPLAITFSVADASSVFGNTPILGPATLFGVLPGDVVIPTVDAFLGAVPIALRPFTPVGQYAQLVTAISNPNYRIAPAPNFPGVLTVTAATANPGAPSDPGFLPGLTQINNPAQTEYDVGGYEQVLPHFTVACNEPPSLPDPNRFSDPDQALRAISQSMENYFRRCQNPTQTTIGDALDAYAAKLQVLAPRLPPALRNVPAIVAEGAKRVRAAASRAEAVAVLRQTVAAVHKEIALVLSDDPQTRSREVRDGDVIGGALGGASVALVNSGSL